MIFNISELAGIIWRLLDEKGPLSLSKIKSATEADDFHAAAALGWLAREDKIDITKSARSIKVSLK